MAAIRRMQTVIPVQIETADFMGLSDGVYSNLLRTPFRSNMCLTVIMIMVIVNTDRGYTQLVEWSSTGSIKADTSGYSVERCVVNITPAITNAVIILNMNGRGE